MVGLLGNEASRRGWGRIIREAVILVLTTESKYHD